MDIIFLNISINSNFNVDKKKIPQIVQMASQCSMIFGGGKTKLILNFATKNGHELRSFKIRLRIFAPYPSNREVENNITQKTFVKSGILSRCHRLRLLSQGSSATGADQ